MSTNIEMLNVYMEKCMKLTTVRCVVWCLTLSSFLSYIWLPNSLSHKIVLTAFIFAGLMQLFTSILLNVITTIYNLSVPDSKTK